MKRVVFCPYLSAMWASMAPLYAEHVAAGDSVTVMSLPYAVRDSAGTPGEYRTDLGYPVPQTVASIHVLKEMHPDVICFHNPYDNINAITQINPAYYSRKLAECTDDLTYVPYYTMGGDLEHIIKAPGVRRADHIIVYSQEQADNYFSVLGQYSVDWKQRIIIKQRPAPRTDYEMPAEWIRIARGRKLVMLGTSISALITRNAEEFTRIWNTIMQNQNDQICLLWRPHPLYDATLTALLPSLRPMYRSLMLDFVEYQHGILDTSWDLERAVTLCTEYLGDPSSVVWFFHEQNKPVRFI